MGREADPEWTQEMKDRATAVAKRLRPELVWVGNEPTFDRSNMVPNWVHMACYATADGFYLGFDRSGAEYDWSHIRDSSWAAWERMEAIVADYVEVFE